MPYCTRVLEEENWKRIKRIILRCWVDLTLWKIAYYTTSGKRCQQVYQCSSRIALIYFSAFSNFPVTIYTSATLVEIVGSFTFYVKYHVPLDFLNRYTYAMSTNTHFSSDKSWIYHFPTGRTLQSICSYYGIISSFCAFSIFQGLQVARQTGIVNCLAQEHNTMSPVRVQTWTAPCRHSPIDHLVTVLATDVRRQGENGGVVSDVLSATK